MIRIQRQSRPPAVLLAAGRDATDAMCRAYEAAWRRYREGAERFEFRGELYAHPDVKRALEEAQAEKCAFCESRFRHIAFGDVEHFRPKGGYRQRRGGPLKLPGYYWLAYDWDNLLVSCQLCNQRYKANRFPVEKGSPRARNHRHDVRRERPRLIDPGREDPAPYFEWSEHVVLPRGGDRRARATIRILGLNRKELRRRRSEVLMLVRMLSLVAEGHPDPSKRAEARAHLPRMASPQAEYSAMVRAFLARRAPIAGE